MDPMSRCGLLHLFTSLYRKERKVLKILQDFTRKIVHDRRKELELSNKKNENEFVMLDHYIKTSVDGVYLTDNEIREELDTMILNVYETTKNTAAFVLYNLARHPEVQQRVFEEASAVIGINIKRDLDEKDMTNLTYLDAVIKETLRLYSPVAYIGRRLDSEVRTGGYSFPKNAEIAISPFVAGRNPKYFNDPLSFHPDRFLGLKTSPDGFIPFSTGTRKCKGEKIALMMFKIMISKILLNYELSPVKGHEDIDLSLNLVLSPLNGIHLNVKKRQ